MVTTSLILAGLLAALPAEEPPARPLPRPTQTRPAATPDLPLGLRLESGLGGPNGFLGVAGYWAPVSALRLQAGTGIGVSGLQLSLGLSLVIGAGADRFVPGVFASLGLPTSAESASVRTEHDGRALAMPWLNLDLLAWEHVYSRGTSFFVGGGAIAPLRHAHWDAFGLGGQYAPLENWAAFVRFGFGWGLRRPR